MSLVVATIDDGNLRVYGDLRITQPEITPNGVKRHSPNYFNGVLKIIPITQSIMIAYAGAVAAALNAIRSVKDSGVSSKEMPQMLIDIFKENPHECDFLVMDASVLVIYRIRDGQVVSTSQGRTWIGDSQAYNLFQEKMSESGYDTTPDSNVRSVVMMHSLDAVIKDDSIESVGELPIYAFSHKDEMRLSVGFVASSRDLSFDTDMNSDALIMNLTTSVNKGVAAIGIYLTQFQQGAIYIPLIRDEPYIINGKTLGEFRSNVLSEHGIELLGGGFE